jgi:competence protein ComEC
LSLVFAVGASWAEPLFSNCVVTVLDVGQGQSVILQSKGKTFLVDCGGSYGENAADIAARKLLSMGVGRLDAVVLTHEDADHTNGLTYLLTRVDTDMILLPATAYEFELPKTDFPSYVRVTVTDKYGKHAYTNAYFTEDFK